MIRVDSPIRRSGGDPLFGSWPSGEYRITSVTSDLEDGCLMRLVVLTITWTLAYSTNATMNPESAHRPSAWTAAPSTKSSRSSITCRSWKNNALHQIRSDSSLNPDNRPFQARWAMTRRTLASIRTRTFPHCLRTTLSLGYLKFRPWHPTPNNHRKVETILSPR